MMSDAHVSSARRWRLVSRGGAVFLGIVLILAAVGKALDPIVFVEQIRNEGLEGLLSANAVALWGLVLEMGLGTALLLGVRHWIVLVPTSAMVGFFVFLTSKTYWMVVTGRLEDSVSCGCFGVFLQRTATQAFWQDLLLLVPATVLIWASREAWSKRPSPARLAVALLAGSGILLYTVAVPGLPAGGWKSAAAKEAAAGPIFTASQQFQVVVDGVESPEAVAFESPETLQVLVTVPALSAALLLDLRSGGVQRLDLSAVHRSEPGRAELASGFEAREAGRFEMSEAGVVIEVEGREVRLRQR